MLRRHKRVSGGVKVYQKMKSSFFDCFYVMPPLTNGGHYNLAKAPLPPNFSLFKNENDALWIYSTAGSGQDANAAVQEEGTFAEKCYAPLREKPYSLMSFTGNTMYVYIPFDWKMTSEQELQKCVAEYRANLELVRKIVFDDVMPRYYEKQFAAMNDES